MRRQNAEAFRSRYVPRLHAVGLMLGGILVVASPGHAGVLNASWTAPTTNTDGSQLTQLARYRIYYSTSDSPCPGSTFFDVASSTSIPPPNQTVSVQMTGLTTGSIYSVSVTAIDANGNESSCSVVASAPARPDSPEATAPLDTVSAAVYPQIVNGQEVLDTDSFAGTNGWALAAYSGNWPVFANWNQLAIQGSPGFGPGIGGGQANRRDGQTWTDQQWAEIVVGTGFIGTYDELFVGLRATDAEPAGRAYGGGFTVGTALGYQIQRWDPDGTRTVLAVDPAANQGSPGDVINVQIVGSTITLTVTRGGAPLVTLSATDTNYGSGGTPMLWVCCGDPTEGPSRGGSWRAGRVTP